MIATHRALTPNAFGVDEYVGNTPLIRLRRLSELTGCEILGKAEFMNPAGSVKDRAAYGIITDAEAAGRLKLGATIVEGTAGNTVIGLAVIGRARGYRTVIVITVRYPLARPMTASPITVLPAVPSTIVAPSLRRPAASASVMIP